MRDIAFGLIFLAALPLGLLSPNFPVLYWYWVSYFQPHTQAYGFATGLPFGQVAAGLALLTWLFSREKKLPPATPIVVILILLGGWISITTLFAEYPSVAFTKWDVTIKTFLMTIIGISVIQTRERLDMLIWVICIAVGFFGFKLGVFALSGGFGASFRGPSYMNENNGLARGMILIIPLLWYLFFQHKQTWIRAGLATVALSSTAALALSGSRGAWVAALAAAAYVGIGTKRGIFIMCLIGLAGLAAIPMLPEHIVNRFMSIGDMDTDASFQGRMNAWRYGFEIFAQWPIAGGGFGIFELGHGTASHNSYFQMLGEHGGVGLMLFLMLLGSSFLAALQIRRTTKKRPDLVWASQLAFAIQIILIGYSVGSLTINHAVFPLLYGIVGVLASLQIIVRRAAIVSPGAEYVAVRPIMTGIPPARRSPTL